MAAKRSSPKPRHAAKKPRPPASDPLARAKALADQGKIGDALRAAQKVLNADPKQWQALNFMGALLWRQGHRAEALAMNEKAIEVAPDEADIQAELIEQFFSASFKASIDPDRAARIVERFLDRHPPTISFLARYINALLVARRFADGLRMSDRAIGTFPDNTTLHRNKSVALIHLGRAEEAVAAFARSVHPYRPKGEISEGRSRPDAELRAQYAGLAPTYDDNPLHQSFSERMAALITKVSGTASHKRMLDVGCGTGLLGTHIKAARLVGIELSPDMLARARARGVYDELVEGDLVEAMAARQDTFDVVVSSCALYHLADLAPFFRESARLLVPGGYMFFSVDPAPDDMEIGVTEPGEYAHSRAYLRRLAAETGFTETAIGVMPHRICPGFWCAFRRRG
jgi:SAM-dependent methyltransferase